MADDDTERLADYVRIIKLMSDFHYRDTGEWDRLRTLFHPESTVHLMWFDGTGHAFVDAVSHLTDTDVTSKHIIATPVIEFGGHRATAETNAILVTENTALGYGCTTHIRFLDRLLKEGSTWTIAERRSVYDASFIDRAPTDPLELGDFPREYAALAHVLTRSGIPVHGTYPVRGSDAELIIRTNNSNWLNQANPL